MERMEAALAEEVEILTVELMEAVAVTVTEAVTESSCRSESAAGVRPSAIAARLVLRTCGGWSHQATVVLEWMLPVRVFAGPCFPASVWPTMVGAAEVFAVGSGLDRR